MESPGHIGNGLPEVTASNINCKDLSPRDLFFMFSRFTFGSWLSLIGTLVVFFASAFGLGISSNNGLFGLANEQHRILGYYIQKNSGEGSPKGFEEFKIKTIKTLAIVFGDLNRSKIRAVQLSINEVYMSRKDPTGNLFEDLLFHYIAEWEFEEYDNTVSVGFGSDSVAMKGFKKHRTEAFEGETYESRLSQQESRRVRELKNTIVEKYNHADALLLSQDKDQLAIEIYFNGDKGTKRTEEFRKVHSFLG